MCSLLAKRISSQLFSLSPLHHHQHHRLVLLSSLLQQNLSTQPSPQPQKEMPFIAEYLISSFGFPPDRALKVSTNNHLRRIKSQDRPEAVIKFLSDIGLSDTQIKAVVSFKPYLLGYNVDKTLKPNAREMVEQGFSGKLLVQLIRYYPKAFSFKEALSKLLFWRDFVREGDEALVKIIQQNHSLIAMDVGKHIVPKINLLKQYGLSNRDIVDLLRHGNRCMGIDLDSFRQTIKLIEELGLTRESNMFIYGLKAVGYFSKDKLQEKTKLYKTTYGWSKEDICFAFRKFPYILEFSEEKIKSNMDFLTKKAKIEPRSIASKPILLGYSLEKRLKPRHYVLSILAAKGLHINCSLSSACGYTEKRFLEKYVEPYKKDMPELAQAYSAASGREVSV